MLDVNIRSMVSMDGFVECVHGSNIGVVNLMY